MDVLPETYKLFDISHSPVSETSLPNLEALLQFLLHSEREASLYELQGSFQGDVSGGCDQQVKMIGHQNKCLQSELVLISVFEQHAAKKFGELGRLEKSTLLPSARANKKCLLWFNTRQSSRFQSGTPAAKAAFQGAPLWHS